MLSLLGAVAVLFMFAGGDGEQDDEFDEDLEDLMILEMLDED